MDNRQISLGANNHQDHYTRGVGKCVDEHVNLAEKVTEQPAVDQVVSQRLINAEYAHAEVRNGEIG